MQAGILGIPRIDEIHRLGTWEIFRGMGRVGLGHEGVQAKVPRTWKMPRDKRLWKFQEGEQLT